MRAGGVSVDREKKMRTFTIASAACALLATTSANAQQPAAGHGPGASPSVTMGKARWGSNVNGRWWGGVNAPGGWTAYRRPARGYVLPSYWISPRFTVSNWNGYGLTQPTNGYRWIRYYDDAVLIDGRGSVYDVAEGVDWDRYDQGYYTDDTSVYAGPADRGAYVPDDGYPRDGRIPRAPDDRRDRVSRRGSNGLAGAAVGAAVGGVAGNVIAGRGNRLGGTLIGAGVGAAAGYAVDKSSDRAGDRRRRDYAPPPPPPPAYGVRYDDRDDRRGSDGLAGAAVGGVVGGVAGNVIAGRGNRLGGTLIGAGVGAAAGYAIDRGGSKRRGHHDRDGYPMGGEDEAYGYRDGAQPYPPQGYPARVYPHQGGTTVTNAGGTVVTTTSAGGYAAGGYYYPAGSTTTVVVQSAPVVTTTTTTETYEDRVSYARPHARRTKLLKRYRAPAKCSCR